MQQSSKQLNSVNAPSKGTHIISPLTNRPCKVGGKAWKKLVKDGLIENNFQSFEDKIPKKAGKKASKAAAKVINKNMENLSEVDDLEAELERLILAEMTGIEIEEKKKPKKAVGRPKKEKPVLKKIGKTKADVKKKKKKVVVESSSEEESEESESDEMLSGSETSEEESSESE
jgi:hypothetical protein